MLVEYIKVHFIPLLKGALAEQESSPVSHRDWRITLPIVSIPLQL